MALNKDIVSLPIDKGLNTKVDPKQDDPGYLRKAENLVYETLKLLKKRNGYDQITLEMLDGTQITDPKVSTKFKKELVLMDNDSLYAYSSSLKKFTKKGTLYPTEVKSKIIVKNSTTHTNPSGALVADFEVFAWENTSGGISYSVLDTVNKNFLTSDMELSAVGLRPIVTSIQNTVYIFYAEGTNLKFKTFNLISPETLSSATTAKTDFDSTTNMIDAVSVQNFIFVVYNSSVAGSKLSLFRVDSDNVVSSTISFATKEASQAITIMADEQNRIIFAWSNGSTLEYAIYSLSLAGAILNPTVISAVANTVNVTIAQSTNSMYKVFWEVSATEARDHFIKSADLTSTGTVSNLNSSFMRSVGLASKAFKYNETIFVTVVHDSSLQPTYFIVDENSKMVTKFNNQNAAGLVESGVLNKVSQIDTYRFLIPNQIKGRTLSNDNAFYSLLGVNSTILNFNPSNIFQNAFLADNLHICSGILKMYDGSKVVEHGFHVFPENLKQQNPIPVTAEITVIGATAVSEVQFIKFSKVPTSGTFTLTLGAETTSPIAFDALNINIISNIEALSAVTTASVTGNFTDGHTITITTPKQNFGMFSVTNNSLKSNAVSITAAKVTEGVAPLAEIQLLDYTAVPDSGSFAIDIAGETTALIAFNASNATIKAEIEALAAITTVTVTGNFTTGHSITFDSPVQSIATMSIVTNTLTSSGAAVTVYPAVDREGITGVKEVQTLTFGLVPTAGAYTIEIGGQVTSSLAFNASNATIQAAIDALVNVTNSTVTGSYAAGLTITIDSPVQNWALFTTPSNTLTNSTGTAITATVNVITEGVAEVKEVQTLTFGTVPTFGAFKMVVGAETTTAINYSMSASDVKAALDALTAITTVSVTGNFTTGFTITFDSPVTGISLISTDDNSLATSDPQVGEMSDGDYSYVAVYKWTDNSGKDHLSAPTLIDLNVILNGATATQTTTIRVPTLRITEKEDVVLELYRTEANGTVYYKVTSDIDLTFNDKTVDYVDIIDTLSDTDLITKELLYTTGNVIENIPAPSCNMITVYQNRLAVVGEDENTVYFSKIAEEGKPVEYTDLITKYFDPIGGEISAIAAMDDKFIAFEKDATLFISGDGPTNSLQQDSFTKPEILASDIGCTAIDSTVYTPLGLMFKSRKGIWLLNKSLTFQYVGDKVEQYNDYNITSVKVVGELNQVRFLTDNSVALVYNYNLDRWATFQNHGGLSSVVIENDYYYIREDGALYVENRDSFADAASPIKFKIETSWLYLTDIQGFQRIYHALILGTYKSTHKLRIKIAYNFVEAFTDETVVNVTDFIDATAYGGYSPYGSPSTLPYGGNLDQNLYQIRVDLARQKCQAIKISIEDAQDEVGEGLSLSSITLRVGIKPGEFALPAANKTGAK